MGAIDTGLKLEEVEGDLEWLREEIKRVVPVGFEHRNGKRLFDAAERAVERLLGDHADAGFWSSVKNVDEDKVRCQIATLGGGNHFIEVQADEEDTVWVMLHSGSRNIGKQICDYYHKQAVGMDRDWRTPLPNEALAFFPYNSDIGQEYRKAMEFALDFAYANRHCMFCLVGDAFDACGMPFPPADKLHKR